MHFGQNIPYLASASSSHPGNVLNCKLFDFDAIVQLFFEGLLCGGLVDNLCRASNRFDRKQLGADAKLKRNEHFIMKRHSVFFMHINIIALYFEWENKELP